MVLFSSDLIDCFFFFKQKTAYEMRISDWSSDVCSSDLEEGQPVDIAIVVVAAFLASGLTLYSGFGLGTVLLPVFAIFFPAEAALAAVAVVHLLNNLFKGVLVGKWAHLPTILSFGLPAIQIGSASCRERGCQ